MSDACEWCVKTSSLVDSIEYQHEQLQKENEALKSRVETAEYLLDVERKVKAKSITECVELEAKVQELELFIAKNTDDNLTISDMTIFREIFARQNQNNF